MADKTKKEINIERKERLEKFKSSVLPEVLNIYKVTSHGGYNAPDTMYKIVIHDRLSYDYYPMSEKARRAKYSAYTGKVEYSWSEVSMEHLLQSLKKLKKQK